ncbi:MAG: hypothetical protein COA78_13705 [Blastopirellula sp.]|nr:MAG: hypothetical protein COA78_13705 [Blastopirellula sp.]
MRKVGIVLAVVMGSGFLLIVGGIVTLFIGAQFITTSTPSTSTAYFQPAIGPAITPTTVTPASYPGSSSSYQDPYFTQAGYSSPGSVPVSVPPYQSASYNGVPQLLQPAYSSISTPASAEKSQLEQRYVELSRQHATEMNEAELEHKVAQLDAKVRIKRAMMLLYAVEQEMDFLEEKFETTRLAAEATAIKQPLAQMKSQLTAMADLPEQVKQSKSYEATAPSGYSESAAGYPETPTDVYPAAADFNHPRFQFSGDPPPGSSIVFDERELSQSQPPATGYAPAPVNSLPPQPLDAPATSNDVPAAYPIPVHVATPRKTSPGRVLTVTPGANLIGEEEEPLLGLDDEAEAEPDTKPTKQVEPVTASETERETIPLGTTVTPRIIITEEEEPLGLGAE